MVVLSDAVSLPDLLTVPVDTSFGGMSALVTADAGTVPQTSNSKTPKRNKFPLPIEGERQPNMEIYLLHLVFAASTDAKCEPPSLKIHLDINVSNGCILYQNPPYHAMGRAESVRCERHFPKSKKCGGISFHRYGANPRPMRDT